MPKDFEQWHLLKLAIDRKDHWPFFREGEIWWCSLGANIGIEEDGKHARFERPILVFHKFNKEMFWALPMTSSIPHGQYDRTLLFKNQPRTILFSQIRTLSAKRLIRKIGKLHQEQFATLISYFKNLPIIKTDPLRDPRIPQVYPETLGIRQDSEQTLNGNSNSIIPPNEPSSNEI